MDDATQRLIPTSIAHYRILGRLGSGGMGDVYVAEDTRLRRKVALKVMQEGLVAESEAGQRMLREARAAAALDHPNVCAIHEVGETDDRTYIVMQFVDGETLADRLARERLSFQETVDIGIQIASALEEAHAHGIVHRDVKALNVMITPRGVVKVLDFGLAKAFEAAADTEMVLTRPGAISGTPPYMSPEQLRGHEVDGRSDVFSLGVLLYEMASGRRPFDRATPVATITAVLFEEPAPLTDPAFAPLAPVITAALQKDVRQRFQSAAEMRDALQAVRGGSSVSFAVPAPTPRSEPKMRRQVDPEAEALYLKGRLQWNKRNPEALRMAVGLFQESIERDPLFARPYAGLADVYVLMGFLQAVPPADVAAKAKAAARRAVELDPSLAEPHATLGYLHAFFDWKIEAALEEFEEAMRLDPTYPWAPHWCGFALCGAGQFDRAIAMVERARDLDPLSPIISVAVGVPRHFARRYDEALAIYQRILETESGIAPAHAYAGLTYEALGRHDEAIAAHARSAELARNAPLFLSGLGHAYAGAGKVAEAERVAAELEAMAAQRYVSPYVRLLVEVGLCRFDSALQWLERALAERSPWLWNVQVDPRFDALHEDARARELLAAHGLSALGAAR